ncbi:fructosamine kinase family protein [Propionibacterium sp.]|uniref:fructosamine kinase family protein n=1 Tax=Propionibacterium sp. TaxID=1977903 RepID=UPI0039EB4110
MDEFVKGISRPQPDQVEWEVRCLDWLRVAGGAPVVPVLRHDDHSLTEQKLVPVSPESRAAEEFGARLAHTHSAGAATFGAGPDGWDDEKPGWLGRARLPLGHYDRWGEFYSRIRVQPYVRQARDAGHFGPAQCAVFDSLCARLADGDFDDDLSPARLHGDLWAGNAMYTPNGVTLIDPAAHGGHPLGDLAMLELFGFPALEHVWRGYIAEQPAAAGWRDLIALHQVHPLLVHTVLFGGSYADEALAAASRYISRR